MTNIKIVMMEVTYTQIISHIFSSQFLCPKSSKCIPLWWTCDKHQEGDDRTNMYSDYFLHFQLPVSQSKEFLVHPTLVDM